jgi:putative colanic acid biosynthesis acetyltransferase WcaF
MTPVDPHILDARTHDTFDGTPSFSRAHRISRVFFSLVWLVLARWTPPPLRRWRNMVLRMCGARIHPTANVYASARVWYPPNLVMASFSTLGPGVNCYNMATISVGERAVVSQGAHLCAGSHDVDDPAFQLYANPIALGDNVWIAAEAFVGPGVTVGERAVLGARGVAMSDLAAGMIYVGNPAKPLRPRGAS